VALNASKDRFFSIVSHDLRTPFNGLIGNAQLLQMMLEDKQIGGEIAEIAETILSSAQSAHRLLENLLSWAMIQQGSMEFRPGMVLLDQLIPSTAEMFVPVADQKEIRLTLSVAEGLIAFSDANMLQTILRNLLSNAIKFTPPGGKVTIDARPQLKYDTSEPRVIEISVSDTGVGILESDLHRLFKIDEHFTTKGTASEEGAGLGLSLCKEMAEFMHGQLWIESKPGTGTRVSFTVPLPEGVRVLTPMADISEVVDQA
jgi:signal transduction histidine kinase